MTDPDGAAVRGDPSMEQANIIGSADPGSQFQVLGEFLPCEGIDLNTGCDSWARIVYPGHEQAWICLGSGTAVYGRLDYPNE
ncbi:MAG: SH3 domain-containing protein [Thermoflexales bacterium]|nr:SH3 domain-containing protein [Thermoflexales bacterium]MBP8240729.1 SH3 domain-containing protein [Thermoflexales bacterium]